MGRFLMTIVAPQCGFCAHFHRNNVKSNTCDAFPKGIAEDIWLNKVSHLKPIDGDNGIQFEARDSKLPSPLL